MTRFLFLFACFIFLFILESSFLSGLPAPFRFVPLLFTVSLFLLHTLRMPVMGGWLLFKGFLDDFWHIGILPFETILFLLLILFTYYLGKNILSHRSFYAVLGCLWINTLLFISFQGIYFGWIHWKEFVPFDGREFFLFALWQFIWVTILGFGLFPIVKYLRTTFSSYASFFKRT